MTNDKGYGRRVFGKHQGLPVYLFLVMGILAVYRQVTTFDFVFDDFRYLVENSRVQSGLTLENILWALTTRHAGNWHPLTWLSHLLDVQLYGLNAGGHHLTSLFFHLANTLLLLMVFNKMTGRLWPSAVVAALFGLHPLHVESVAWVSERKDVLSTFFWLLTMWGYIRYLDHPKFIRYLAVFVLFALGLMAKAMLVTLPFVLLLLDYWPLQRFQKKTGRQPEAKKSSLSDTGFFQALVEKIPLLALVALTCVLTYNAQHSAGTVRSLDVYSLPVRVANALVSYVKYVCKAIWPVDLAVYYPHPGTLWPGWQIAAAAVLVAAACLGAVRAARQYPFVFVGLFWYFGTLVPVIGLVQIGSQAMADRYTYIPLTGLFIIVAWGAAAFLERRRQYKKPLAVVAAVLLAILATTTWKQAGYWKNNITLFEHALKISGSSYLVHYNLGTALDRNGRTKEAVGHYLKALKERPHDVDALNNLGVALFRIGDTSGAAARFTEALRIRPDYVRAKTNLEKVLQIKTQH